MKIYVIIDTYVSCYREIVPQAQNQEQNFVITKIVSRRLLSTKERDVHKCYCIRFLSLIFLVICFFFKIVDVLETHCIIDFFFSMDTHI